MATKPYIDKRRGTWHCKYRPDPAGPWVIVTLGKHPTPIDQARPPRRPPQFVVDRRNEFAEIEYRAAKGLSQGPVREKPLAGYLADYVAGYEVGHDAGSLRQVARHARTFEAYASARGIKTVQAVTKGVCRDYLEHRAKSGVGYDTLATEKGYLSGIWSRAVDDGLMTTNPWSGVKPPGKPAERTWTFWSDAEVAKIAAACHKPWQSDLVLILANTGLRISAGLAMAWKWIDWDAGTIKVPSRDDKAGKGYVIPMTSTARDVLTRRFAEQEGSSDLVFPNPYRGSLKTAGGVVPYDSAREAIMRAIAKAGVKPGTPHDLRHTFARWLVRQPGIPLNVVQAALGHADLKTTQRYLTMDGASLAGMFDSIGLGEGKEG